MKPLFDEDPFPSGIQPLCTPFDTNRDKAGRHLTEEQLGAYEISQAGYDEPDPEHRRNLLKWIITKMIPLQPREKSQGSGNPASMDTVSPSSGTDIFS